MSKARVRMLSTEFSPRSGGVYEAIAGQARGLQKAGRTVDVINYTSASSEPQTQAHEFAIQDVRAGALSKTLRSSETRVLHSHGLWIPAVSVNAYKWRRRNLGRLVISPHGMLDPWALQNGKWKKRAAMRLYEKAALNAADCLHALNQSEAEAIQSLGLAPPIAIIPNGVDLPMPQSVVSASSEDTRKVLLFLGRLHPKKGLLETLTAWAETTKQHPKLRRSWRLVIAGWDDGGHEAVLRNRVAALGIEQDVSFVGAVYGAEKQALLAQASAFILASQSEGLPMAVLEAWANRVPVFMSHACNLPIGFEKGAAIETGTRAQSIAAALGETLEHGALEDIGQAGRKLVEAQFTWDAVGLQLDALYAWVSGETDTRPETVLI